MSSSTSRNSVSSAPDLESASICASHFRFRSASNQRANAAKFGNYRQGEYPLIAGILLISLVFNGLQTIVKKMKIYVAILVALRYILNIEGNDAGEQKYGDTDDENDKSDEHGLGGD